MDEKIQNTQSFPKITLAYNKLKKLIFMKKLVPGQKLIYVDLENRLQMSKTPIISALNRLESEGYVYVKKNSGYYIRDINEEEIFQIMEARELLELANIDTLMQKYSDNDLKELGKIHAEYLSYSPYFFDRKKARLNSEFHLKIAKMGRNSFLIKYIEHIYDWLNLRVWSSVFPAARVQKSGAEHEAILQAIREHNKAETKRLLGKHLRGAAKVILKSLQDEQRIY